jgi:hypothetical protein
MGNGEGDGEGEGEGGLLSCDETANGGHEREREARECEVSGKAGGEEGGEKEVSSAAGFCS